VLRLQVKLVGILHVDQPLLLLADHFDHLIGEGLRKEINETLLQLRGSGFLEDLEKRWFGSLQAPQGL